MNLARILSSAKVLPMKEVGAELGISVDVLARDGQNHSAENTLVPSAGGAIVVVRSNERDLKEFWKKVNGRGPFPPFKGVAG